MGIYVELYIVKFIFGRCLGDGSLFYILNFLLFGLFCLKLGLPFLLLGLFGLKLGLLRQSFRLVRAVNMQIALDGFG